MKIAISGINRPDSSRFPVRVYNTLYSELTVDTFFLPYTAPATLTLTFTPTPMTLADTAGWLCIGWQRIYDTVNMPYAYSFTIDSIQLQYDTVVVLPVML